ncbi:hypothetical protein KSP40_PGU010718 [Platanthera guangdongensis]|uniref:CID domain-containing protein n=1 Tax=Platanthera guangdongensis TaxID=2320717 RepID=A0ABR2MWS8_9ASPA
MNSIFSEQILADKLSKLNSTQQCIETLSRWCIFHRRNAEQVVQTWEKQFSSSSKERKTLFLYLANDILQNSRCNGMGFVGEFWKVLPSALKDVTENCDDHGKTVLSRLAAAAESSTTRTHPLSLDLEQGSAWSKARPGARLGLEQGSAWSKGSA